MEDSYRGSGLTLSIRQGSPGASEIIDDYGAVVHLWLKQCLSTLVGWPERARTVDLHDESRSLRPSGQNRGAWLTRLTPARGSPDRPSGAALRWRHRSRYRRDKLDAPAS